MDPILFMMTGPKQELQQRVGWHHLQTRMCRLLGDDHLEGASSLGNTLHIMEIVVNITHRRNHLLLGQQVTAF